MTRFETIEMEEGDLPSHHPLVALSSPVCIIASPDSGSLCQGSPLTVRHVTLSLPFIKKRDFCVATLAQPVPGLDEEWVVGSVSVEHASVPEVKGYIRSRTVINGWHVKPLTVGAGAAPACGVTIVSVTNLGGTFPSAFIKMAEGEGGKLINSLAKHMKKAHEGQKTSSCVGGVQR